MVRRFYFYLGILLYNITLEFLAIDKGRSDIVRILINNGADVDKTNIYGFSSIFYGTKSKNLLSL
jgi:hypothetical protein